MITTDKTIGKFNTKDFRCKHCNKLLISEELINNLIALGETLNYSKAKIISGYRCKDHPVEIKNKNTGQHTKGLAVDIIYYDNNGSEIPSKIVICKAFDLELFKGMANVEDKEKGETHLDIRETGSYMGDETIDYKSHYTNPYNYYNVSQKDIEKYITINENKVLVKVNNLYIRKSYSTSSEKIAVATKGKYYPFTETYNNEGYTWYKIGENEFIADNGTYLEVFNMDDNSKEMQKLKDEISIKDKLIKELKEEINTYKYKYTCTKTGKYIKTLNEGETLIIK